MEPERVLEKDCESVFPEIVVESVCVKEVAFEGVGMSVCVSVTVLD